MRLVDYLPGMSWDLQMELVENGGMGPRMYAAGVGGNVHLPVVQERRSA